MDIWFTSNKPWAPHRSPKIDKVETACGTIVAFHTAAIKCFWIATSAVANNDSILVENAFITSVWEMAVRTGIFWVLNAMMALGCSVKESTTIRRMLYLVAM